MGALDRSPKANWVEKAGGLPAYIERIAVHLHTEQGMPISRAIAVAVNTVKRWAAGGTTRESGGQKVTPATQAKAAAAVAEWNAKKAKATSLSEDRVDPIDLAGKWKHGYIPVDATAMRIKAKGNAKTTALYQKRYGSDAVKSAARAEKSKRAVAGNSGGPIPKSQTDSASAARVAAVQERARRSASQPVPGLAKGQEPGKVAPMTKKQTPSPLANAATATPGQASQINQGENLRVGSNLTPLAKSQITNELVKQLPGSTNPYKTRVAAQALLDAVETKNTARQRLALDVLASQGISADKVKKILGRKYEAVGIRIQN